MRTNLEINFPINVDLNDLVLNVTREDALKIIDALDKKFADCDFTLDVLRALIKSLESDMTREEIKGDLGL